MGYNPFRWYTQGKYRKKPLKSNELLLDKIKNGDFEYSPFFLEADDNEKLYTKMYNEFMSTSLISDLNDRSVEAHEYARMKRIKAQKLMEKGVEEEQVRLNELKTELNLEFKKDLWDKCLQKQRGKGTTEDMYWWYKKQCKMGQTPSEIAIALGRTTTKGLRQIFIIMGNGVLRKVCNVINSCENENHLNVARKYIELYYKQYSKQHSWVIESHWKNKRKTI